MSAREEKELTLLRALDTYRCFHTVGWLVANSLIPADWPSDDVYAHLDELARLGQVTRQFSETRRQPMYEIAAEGAERINRAGHHDRVIAASEEHDYVRPGPRGDWEPVGSFVASGSGQWSSGPS